MTQFVVFGTNARGYLTGAFPDGRTPLEYLVERIEALREIMVDNGVELAPVALVVLPSAAEPADALRHDPYRVIRDSGDGAADLFRTVENEIAPGVEQIVWLDLDGPFFRVDLAWYLYRLHTKNWCDYTFADGFPEGYAAQVLRADILGPPAALADNGETPRRRTALFDAVSSDINAFDVETEAAHEDWALLRASLTVDNRSNAMLCHRLVQRGVANHHLRDTPNPEYERFPDEDDPLLRVLLDEPTIRRTLPRYYQVQITERMTQRPYWTPWSDERWAPAKEQPESMPIDSWRRVLQAIAEVTPEATIAIGYRGEPAEHPEIVGVLKVADEYPDLSFYVETNGVHWSDAATEALCGMNNLAAVIVYLDASDGERYSAIRGSTDEYARAIAFVERMREQTPGIVYVQATRMTDNEDDLPSFYKYWNGVPGVTPLIEKYNSFAGTLPDRRPADLTPLDRPACVHLERDLVVLFDGTVPMCHQDIDRTRIRGNVLDEDIETIWARGAGDFQDHCAGRYGSICKVCDEYYTFNL